jgi:hypothetical protein
MSFFLAHLILRLKFSLHSKRDCQQFQSLEILAPALQ